MKYFALTFESFADTSLCTAVNETTGADASRTMAVVAACHRKAAAAQGTQLQASTTLQTKLTNATMPDLLPHPLTKGTAPTASSGCLA